MLKNGYLCIGPPGCGKTSFIAHEVGRAIDAGHPPSSIDIRSLTRAGAQQAAGVISLPEECIGTQHSAAFRALGLMKDQVAETKVAEFNSVYPHFAVSRGKTNLDDEGEIADAVAGNGDVLLAEMNRCRLRMEPITIEVVQEFADAWHGWMREAVLCDFTGMLERCLVETMAMPGNPRVMFLDEGQDTSRLGLALVEHWGQAADRVIIAADPVQCIYRWSGAAPEDLAAIVPESNRRHLKRSHRIPRAVHETAVAIAAGQLARWDINFEPRDADGAVTRGGDPATIVDVAAEAEGSVMILASCSYMLHPVLAELRSRGMPFANPWRPSRGDWNPLRASRVNTVLDYRQGPQNDLRSMKWLMDLRAEAFTRGTKARLKRGEIDTPGDYRAWCALFASESHANKALGERDPDWLLDHVEPPKRAGYEYVLSIDPKKLLERPAITVGTIHSTKGGEASTVILMPDLSPQAWEARASSEEGRMDVERMFYVGTTRARERLIITAAVSSKEVQI